MGQKRRKGQPCFTPLIPLLRAAHFLTLLWMRGAKSTDPLTSCSDHENKRSLSLTQAFGLLCKPSCPADGSGASENKKEKLYLFIMKSCSAWPFFAFGGMIPSSSLKSIALCADHKGSRPSWAQTSPCFYPFLFLSLHTHQHPTTKQIFRNHYCLQLIQDPVSFVLTS